MLHKLPARILFENVEELLVEQNIERFVRAAINSGKAHNRHQALQMMAKKSPEMKQKVTKHDPISNLVFDPERQAIRDRVNKRYNAQRIQNSEENLEEGFYSDETPKALVASSGIVASIVGAGLGRLFGSYKAAKMTDQYVKDNNLNLNDPEDKQKLVNWAKSVKNKYTAGGAIAGGLAGVSGEYGYQKYDQLNNKREQMRHAQARRKVNTVNRNLKKYLDTNPEMDDKYFRTKNAITSKASYHDKLASDIYDLDKEKERSSKS